VKLEHKIDWSKTRIIACDKLFQKRRHKNYSNALNKRLSDLFPQCIESSLMAIDAFSSYFICFLEIFVFYQFHDCLQISICVYLVSYLAFGYSST